ncbi:OprO/OprP family phosphate-selective porin [Thermodesulfobacteriota bacterium]
MSSHLKMQLNTKFILDIIVTLLISASLLNGTNLHAEEPPPPGDMEQSEYRGIMKNLKKGIWIPYANWNLYVKEGFRIDSPGKNFTLKINLSVMADGGYISADEELETAFPDLEGPSFDFRWLRLTGFGTIYDWAQFKLDIDFANIRDVKDNYIRLTKLPLIGFLTLGHMKEPFSLEAWAGLKAVTFMERALPVNAFAPGRNFGIRYYRSTLDQLLTWGVGAYLNTGSFGSVGDTRNQLSEANGWNLTGRITYRAQYEDEGRRLMHLGFSYTHRFRNESDPDFRVVSRVRPETRLSDDRLVDTGEFLTDGAGVFNPELAYVKGPISFQGEYFHVFNDSEPENDPTFWGFYLYGSYFLTGEHRHYGRRAGTFFRLQPNQDFHFRQGGWGAWELATRFSLIDLNDEGIRGGKEANFTAGLNWYLNLKMRFMLNYIRAKVKNRATSPSVGSGDAHIFQARFQFEF